MPSRQVGVGNAVVVSIIGDDRGDVRLSIFDIIEFVGRHITQLCMENGWRSSERKSTVTTRRTTIGRDEMGGNVCNAW